MYNRKIWLGNTITRGAEVLTWLNAIEFNYSHQLAGQPNGDLNHSNGICMDPVNNSKWTEYPVL